MFDLDNITHLDATPSTHFEGSSLRIGRKLLNMLIIYPLANFLKFEIMSNVKEGGAEQIDDRYDQKLNYILLFIFIAEIERKEMYQQHEVVKLEQGIEEEE